MTDAEITTSPDDPTFIYPVEQEWEFVGSGVYRFVVPGGWLYSYSYSRRYMVFVPEPKS